MPDSAIVGLTGGTTLEPARCPAARPGITVVTNAIDLAADLTGRPGAFARIAPLSAIDTVITDGDGPAEQVAAPRSDRTVVVTV